MSDVLLSVEDLAVEYRPRGRRRTTFRALDGVSIQVERGRTLGIVGESGSGKTTLGRAVLGLAPVSAGSVVFRGQDISRATRRDRKRLSAHMQVVFQDPYTSLNPSMTVEDILVEPLRATVDKGQARDRVRELFERVHLPADSGSRFPREFSGGQRQRIAIARALALSPELIVCDEPVSALDLSTQAHILDLLLEIQRETGVSYLFISHDLDVIRHISHDVAVVHRGLIVEQGPAVEVTQDPRDPYTRRLLYASPLPDPDRQAERREQRRALAAASAG